MESKQASPLVLALCSSVLVSVLLANPEDWEKRVIETNWVAYTPPSGNPDRGLEATPDAIREDLQLLRRAKFTGLVTYGSAGVMGEELVRRAQEAGFQGLVMGIWDPNSRTEMAAAVAASGNPVVLGYCVGNEGLGERYTPDQLSAAIQSLRTLTGKPVTTSEQYGDYSDQRLLALGDWVFPNVHPYFYHVTKPDAAVQWTKAAYDDLKRRTKRFVWFKEVGLPTSGDPEGKMSEAVQEQYYAGLAKTGVRFVYFEGFDQPWKTHLSIEPHWGIFKADHTPKSLAAELMGEPIAAKDDGCFFVYEDADSKRNHFIPSGFMGDINDIRMDDQCKQNPHSGNSCILVAYDAKGKGPGGRPAKWAGVYWQQPAKNWGTDAGFSGRGYDLSVYVRVAFWARTEKECQLEFKVGGIDGPYGDSLKPAKAVRVRLGPKWQRYEIGLKGANLKHIIGGFCWATNWDDNPQGATFYLDDICFER